MSAYDNAVANAPQELQCMIMEMDVFLKSLKLLKFKRSIERSGTKINYVSAEYGISYAIMISAKEQLQHFGWYYLHDKVTNNWYRKHDYLVDTLTRIAKTAPQATGYLFDSINECTACKDGDCGKIPYEYDDRQKFACYGRIHLPMSHDGFANAKLFFSTLVDILQP